MTDQEMTSESSSRKRVSSAGEIDFSKKTKYSVTGELVEKSRIDINGQPYYILKLLVENKKKEYFTTARINAEMKINQNYEMTYVNEKRSLKVIDFNPIEAKNSCAVPQDALSDSDFEEGNIVSINVVNFDIITLVKNQKKCLMLTNVAMRKITGYQQIEAPYTISSIVRAFRKIVQFGDDETDQEKEEKLMQYFNNNPYNSFELHRMKCKKNNYNDDIYRTLEFTEGSYAEKINLPSVERYSSNLSRGSGNIIEHVELSSKFTVSEEKSYFIIKTKTNSYTWFFNNVPKEELDLIKIKFNQLDDFKETHKITIYFLANQQKSNLLTILAIKQYDKSEEELYFLTPTM
ncbi:LEF-3 [Operophtera brumata nucleopolyhedrovirus]|uniref:LEF-3 n=1 Tax=Operophtera brumata nucleopolyhedrovirus TaxID=1046267 RepID=A0A2H4UZR3_9ABAC|nr:LEF-3 [Operophtera brumata nucleopolyhedrovirus]AUA60294.1 LEF-3 [Operophtera brumata nucleopolyhedrovirus]